MRRATRILTLLIVTLAGAEPLAAQEAPAPVCAASDTELRAAVAEVHEKQRNVGVAAAVAVDGSIVFEAYQGFADLEHEVPVGAETRFGIASVTKAFTAVALLRESAAGRVALDDPVRAHVPDFPEKQGGPITLEMLATHRSGLSHPSDRTPELFATHYESATDALEVFRDAELLFPPGSDEKYSSSNYNLIAAALEGATGKRFQEVVAEQVFEPLELGATGFDDVLAVVPHRARRYSFYHPWTYAESETLYRVPTWDYSFNPGGGNLSSTVADLVAFGSALIEPGRLLSAAGWERLYDDGWFGRRTDSGEKFLYVTGANPGLQAGFAVYPERRATAAVLSNTWGLGSRSGEMVALATKLVELCAPTAP